MPYPYTSFRVHERNRCIQHPVAEAPFVVVPGRYFHQRAFRYLGQRCVKGARCRIVVEIDRYQRRRVVIQNAFQRGGPGRFLHDAVHFLDARGALGDEREIDDGHVDGRYADGVTIELAGKLRDHQADGGGGAGLGGYHTHGGGAGSAQVLVVHVGQYLVIGVGMHRGHKAAYDADLVVKNLHQRGQTVGGARRV